MQEFGSKGLEDILSDITVTWSDVIKIWGCAVIDCDRLRDLATLDEWIMMQLLSAQCLECMLDDLINTRNRKYA